MRCKFCEKPVRHPADASKITQVCGDCRITISHLNFENF